jgi:hypothetical protein
MYTNRRYCIGTVTAMFLNLILPDDAEVAVITETKKIEESLEEDVVKEADDEA